jgi:hypothetical protein
MLFEFLVVSIEITELIWKDIGIRNKIEIAFSKFFLHANHIIAKSIFTCNFVTLGEVVDFLILVKTLIKIAFAAGRAP